MRGGGYSDVMVVMVAAVEMRIMEVMMMHKWCLKTTHMQIGRILKTVKAKSMN